ncbi:hypothetical protein F5X68DRAFT_48701 [Plectosphaerella plurivora]|uniref:Uncharacterized protein n=1 Tax=Plectosphaerella plurivora TaxID=936078 RepID=A0A9P8VLM6_9PEZI|nr:hypothetical protein F5X68DRAFT_48701 [Plectosphaerella plurivora]
MGGDPMVLLPCWWCVLQCCRVRVAGGEQRRRRTCEGIFFRWYTEGGRRASCRTGRGKRCHRQSAWRVRGQEEGGAGPTRQVPVAPSELHLLPSTISSNITISLSLVVGIAISLSSMSGISSIRLMFSRKSAPWIAGMLRTSIITARPPRRTPLQ